MPLQASESEEGGEWLGGGSAEGVRDPCKN